MENVRKMGISVVGILGVVLSQFKWVLTLFNVVKASTILTMLISLGVYAWAFGWKFALALIISLLVHEYGHMIAFHIKGIKTDKPKFIPFLGALITPKGEIKDANTEAFVSYGGPFAGMLLTLISGPLYLLTGEVTFVLMVYLGAILNLFNLFPVSPLDGGRIVSVFSTKIWFLGILVMLGLVFLTKNPLLILIVILGSFNCYNRVLQNRRVSYLKNDLQWIETKKTFMSNLQNKVSTDVVSHIINKQHQWNYLVDDIKEVDERFINIKNKEYKWFEYLFKKKEIRNHENEKEFLFYKKDMLQKYGRSYHTLQNEYVHNGTIISEENMIDSITHRYQQAFDLDYSVLNRRESRFSTEIDKLEGYYEADRNTKLKWFGLYIGLIIILTFLLVKGNQLMQTISM